MKRKLGLLAVLLLLAGTAALADLPPQYVLHVDVLSMNPSLVDDHGKYPASHWADLIKQGQATRVQSIEFVVVSGNEGEMLVGHKDPLVYYDSKAQQFQIQYVDTGLKLDAKVQSATADAVKLEVYGDFAVLQTRRPYGSPPEPLTYPQTTTLQFNSTVEDLNVAQSAVVAHVHGNFIQPIWHMLGMAGTAPAHRDLVLTLTLEQP